jgi:hypothetical protein
MKSLKFLKLLSLCFAVMMCSASFTGLRSVHVSFDGMFGDQKLLQDKKYYCESKKDSISVSTCRFYISSVQLLSNGIVQDQLDYKLIDIFDSTKTHIGFLYSSYVPITSIRFNLGIDSTTNMIGVGEGDLDPTSGMYWAWQSGYINMKLEGNSKLCSKDRGEFQYHLGGYAAPNNSLQVIELNLNADADNDVHVNVNVEQFFLRTDMKNLAHVMSPSAKAVELAGHAAKMFSIAE